VGQPREARAGNNWQLQERQRVLKDEILTGVDELLALCRPYLGELSGVYSDWTPLAHRAWLFEEDVDRDDPWQFKNFRVN